MHTMLRVAFGLAVVALSAPAFAGGAGVTGSWAGEMRQIEVGAETTYPMTLTLAGKTGTATYRTLNCSGSWRRVARRSGYAIYEERAKNQKGATCIDGIVTVKVARGKLILGWVAAVDGEPIVATAALEKAAK